MEWCTIGATLWLRQPRKDLIYFSIRPPPWSGDRARGGSLSPGEKKMKSSSICRNFRRKRSHVMRSTYINLSWRA